MRRVIGLALVLAACSAPDADLVRKTCERLEQGNIQTAGFILAEAEHEHFKTRFVSPEEREEFRAALRAECPTTLIAVTQGLAGRDDPG